jgi:hypothetical protein
MSLGDIIESGLRQRWAKRPFGQHDDIKVVGFALNGRLKPVNAREADGLRKSAARLRRMRKRRKSAVEGQRDHIALAFKT